ncbi:MAG: peptidylprolyl isomerase [Rhodocyclaceae bacterium]
MKFPVKTVVMSAALLLSAMSVQAAPEVVATVNGKGIPKALVDQLVIDNGVQGKPEEAGFRDSVKTELVRREVMAQRAVALKLDKTPAYQAELANVKQQLAQAKVPKEQIDIALGFNTQSMLAETFIQDFGSKYKVTEPAIQARYKEIVAKRGGTEYHIRHIQVAGEAEARAIIGKLAGGARFESLATESQDLGSKDQGGDLGWSKAEGFPPSFAAAVRELKPGQSTREPVQTESGYHVIRVDGSRPVAVGSLDAYRKEIRDEIIQTALDKEVAALFQKAKIQ